MLLGTVSKDWDKQGPGMHAARGPVRVHLCRRNMYEPKINFTGSVMRIENTFQMLQGIPGTQASRR